jgi:YVTN family beta-propeller protein
MRMRIATGTLAAVVALGVTVARPIAADGPYQLIKEIAIGGEGGWDYLTVDSAAKRLYVSHATKVVVVDVAKDAIVGEIADTPGVHGAVPATPGRVVVSNGRGGNASIVDAKTLQTITKVPTEANPDFIMFDPGKKEVYTFNGTGRSATVIDPVTEKVVATIPLGGKPEAGVADPSAKRVYVNVENTNNIAVIDTTTHTVVATWPIAPGEEAAGLAIDLKNHRLFVGAHNNLMLMLDSTNGKVLAQVPIGAGVDATWFDPGTGYAFSSCGDGTVTIAHEDSPAKLTVVQTLTTERGARTMALDAATHRIYLAAAKYETPAAPPAGAAPAPGRGRPTMVPNSMHLLVYGISGK